MGTAGISGLALIHFSGLRLAENIGDDLALLLMGMVALGALIWALAQANGDESAGSEAAWPYLRRARQKELTPR